MVRVAHLQDVVGLARDAEAVLDLRELGDPVGQVVGLRGVEGRGGDERRHEQAERLGVDHRRVAADHPLLLELADPLVHGGGRHAHLRRDVGVGGPRVVLQRGDDVEISLIEHAPIIGPRHRPRPRRPTRRGMGSGDGVAIAGRLRRWAVLGRTGATAPSSLGDPRTNDGGPLV